MIVSYRDKRTQDFSAGKRVKAFSGFERSAQVRLDRLEAATSVKDLAALPGNFFEALKGDRRGQFSIRINDQWRICFEWPNGSVGPPNVEIVDYHLRHDRGDKHNGANSDPPRRAFAGRTRHAWYECRRIFPADRRSNQSRDIHPERPAVNYRRHGFTIGAFFRH